MDELHYVEVVMWYRQMDLFELSLKEEGGAAIWGCVSALTIQLCHLHAPVVTQVS